MLTIILAIAGLAVLIIGHEAGHFFAAKKFGMRVDEFGIGFPPRAKAIKKDETEYSLNWLPFGGFVRIRGEGEDPAVFAALSPEEKKRIFVFQPAYRRIIVIVAGVGVNFLLGWILLSAVFTIGVPPALVINGVEVGSPAQMQGIKGGDLIRSFSAPNEPAPMMNKSSYGALSQSFVDFVNAHRGKEISVTVLREGSEKKITMIPRTVTSPNQGALGVQLSEIGIPKEPLLRALGDGFLESLAIIKLVVLAFAGLIKDLIFHASIPSEIGGPVRIFALAYETGKIGLAYLLQIIALISLNLAILNLIPFPALDGGQILLVLIEKIKGSPLNHTARSAINAAGLALLLLLMVLITFRDVQQIFFS